MKKFKDLLADHDYYCHTNNYYSNEAAVQWDTWSEFYEEYEDADIDYNLIFRWDIKEKDQPNQYYMEVFIIHQRKGIFAPQTIEHVNENDFDSIKGLLSKHYDKLMNIWNPFSNALGKEAAE